MKRNIQLINNIVKQVKQENKQILNQMKKKIVKQFFIFSLFIYQMK